MDKLALLKSRVYWANSGKLMAGSYPGSLIEEIARIKISWLLEQGVTYFLDLTREGELKPYAHHLPKSVTYKRMSIIDMGIPGHQEMTMILGRIDAAVESGHVVYVHCWAGRGRTGTVVGCYLVRHGMSGQAALDEIVHLRDGQRDSPEADKQYEFVRNWKEGR